MSVSAILLIGISLVALGDFAVAYYFRGLADRVESGEIVREGFDPAAARKFAAIMFVAAPLMWVVVALMCFDVIPAGLGPIQFGGAQ
jgi:hypothetical protein